MLARARETAAAQGVTNVRFEKGDAQVHPFAEGAFDVAISLFGAMFFNDPTAAFANVRRAIRPGGRLALLAWRDLVSNEWLAALRDALAVGRDLPMPPPRVPGPFAFADGGHAENVLQRAGFTQVRLERADDSLWFGENAEDAFSFVSTFGITKGLTQDLDDQTKGVALQALKAVLREHESEKGVLLGASAWLITASAEV